MERNERALQVSDVFGVGAEWIQQRAMAARGQLDGALIFFSHSQSLDKVGILFLLPSLIPNGLLSYKEHYHDVPEVFYGLDFTVLLLCSMFLSRIKNRITKKELLLNLINRKGDILPNYVNNTIMVKLYTMSTPR